MRGPLHAAAVLHADLTRVEREQLLVLALDDLDGLLREPDADPFTPRRGPCRAGVEDLALTLSAAERLPDNLTVRIMLPPAASPTVPTATAQAALHQSALDSASAAWRDATATRSMGRRQLPAGLTIASVAAFAAYGVAYLAGVVDNLAGTAVLLVVAGLAITVAWVASWMVVESTFFDWQPSARRAHAYDLLARATLEVVTTAHAMGAESDGQEVEAVEEVEPGGQA
jgi:hypothetical protein